MSIWRSFMAARASLSSIHSLSTSRTLISRVLSSRNSTLRFFSENSNSDLNLPDSPPELVGDGGEDTREGFVPVSFVEEESEAPQFGGEGFAHIDSFVAGDEDLGEKSDERLEEMVSTLKASPGGESLRSILSGVKWSPSEEFAVRVIGANEIPVLNLIGFVNWAVKNEREPKFSATSRVVDLLVKAVVSNKDFSERVAISLWDLVKEIGENESDPAGVLETESLNEFISALSNLRSGHLAEEVFEKFGDFKIVRDSDTFYFTFKALCKDQKFDRAWSFCEKMIEDGEIPQDDVKVKKIISLLCNGKKAIEAHSFYSLAKEKKLLPLEFVCKHLIKSLCHDDESVELAVTMLDEFESEARKYAGLQFWEVIQGLCRAKKANEAKNLLANMIADGPPPRNPVFNEVIKCQSKFGELSEAVETLELVKSRGLKPDLLAYTVLIDAYVQRRQMGEACELLSEAKKYHSKLAPEMYHALIRGYCKSRAFDKALELLTEMENYVVRARSGIYNEVIRSICIKALDWETAEKLAEEMRENGLRVKGVTKGVIRAVKEMVAEEVETAANT